jgi:hypothetical protein
LLLELALRVPLVLPLPRILPIAQPPPRKPAQTQMVLVLEQQLILALLVVSLVVVLTHLVPALINQQVAPRLNAVLPVTPSIMELASPAEPSPARVQEPLF